jgi:hypothetical protein
MLNEGGVGMLGGWIGGCQVGGQGDVRWVRGCEVGGGMLGGRAGGCQVGGRGDVRWVGRRRDVS